MPDLICFCRLKSIYCLLQGIADRHVLVWTFGWWDGLWCVGVTSVFRWPDVLHEAALFPFADGEVSLCCLFGEHPTAIWTLFPVIIDCLIWIQLCYTLISPVGLYHFGDIVWSEATPYGLWLLFPIWYSISFNLTLLYRYRTCLSLKHGLSWNDSWFAPEPGRLWCAPFVDWVRRLVITVVGLRPRRHRVRLDQPSLCDRADNCSSLLLTTLDQR